MVSTRRGVLSRESSFVGGDGGEEGSVPAALTRGACEVDEAVGDGARWPGERCVHRGARRALPDTSVGCGARLVAFARFRHRGGAPGFRDVDGRRPTTDRAGASR